MQTYLVNAMLEAIARRFLAHVDVPDFAPTLAGVQRVPPRLEISALDLCLLMREAFDAGVECR